MPYLIGGSSWEDVSVVEEVVWVEVVPREPELIEDPIPELGPLLDQKLGRVPILQTGLVEVGQEAVREQIWSLTQFHSVDFS